MRETVELLASAIHDAKNQLFFAENAVAAITNRHGIDGRAVIAAIEQATGRLTGALRAYQLTRGEMRPSISAIAVSHLIEDLASIHRARLSSQGLAFDISCQADEIWPLDRDLVIDTINNCIQNAARYAKSCVALSAVVEDGKLLLSVEDDGQGFPATPAGNICDNGVGLHIGRHIARMHERHGRHGELRTFTGGRLGGAVAELSLP
jgi:hypothetical protein